MRSRLRSLQGRTLAIVLAVVAGVWLAMALAMAVDARHELDELLDAHLSQAASLLVARQGAELDELEHPLRTPRLRPYAPRVAFQIFHGGALSLRSNDAPATPFVGPGTDGEGFRTVSLAGTPWRVFVARGPEADVRICVGEQMAARDEIALAVLRSALWPMALAMPLLAFGAAWGVRRGLRPLNQLGRWLGERAPNALGEVKMARAPSEIQPILDALNRLFGRIDALLESERRFTADAAHELRTPIAAIRAQAQVALAVTDDRARVHALQATLEGCDRATRLVEQLLMLARLDAGAALERGEIDLCALARQVLADAGPAALAKGQVLELDAPGRCAVRGVGPLLGAMLRNLVDNAVRYSPAAARVQVGVARDDAGATVCIEDGGPGLRGDERRRLGDRFFRADPGQESGSGLGWSIVRRIAELHGVEIEVDGSPALGGLRVRLRFGRPGAGE